MEIRSELIKRKANEHSERSPTTGRKSMKLVKETEEHIHKIQKCREQNRVHAKKTRLRKKSMLEGLKAQILQLQNETMRLVKLLEEKNIANILLGLGDTNGTYKSNPDNEINIEGLALTNGNIIAQLHCKVRAEAAEAQLQNQQQDRHQFTSSKTDSEGDSCGSYTFYNDLDYDEGPEQIQEMTEFAVDYDQKREKNRMHARSTRRRKKLFTSHMQDTVVKLEQQNELLEKKLNSCVI